MKMIPKLSRRYQAWKSRRIKARNYCWWFRRWDSTVKRCRSILSDGEPTIERFNRFVKHHKKLMNLLDRKTF